MKKAFPWVLSALLAFWLAVPLPAAQADIPTLIREAVSVPSVTGNEGRLAAKIMSYLPKEAVLQDTLGSVYARVGRGEPRVAVLAPLDEYGWFVSGVTPDGYLRLDRSSQPHPNFDSYLLGHPVVISTRKGPLYGLVAQPAMHLLTRERREELRSFSLDLAYVDVGARSDGEVKTRGIEFLDAVSLWPELSQLADDKWAGPSLGQKTACALLTAAADDLAKSKPSQEIVFGWMAQTKFPARGGGGRSALGAARASRTLQPKKAVVIDGIPADRGEKGPLFGGGIVVVLPKEGGQKLRESVEAIARENKITVQFPDGVESPLLNGLAGPNTEALLLALPVKFGQTPSEVVDMKDVRALKTLLVRLLQSGRLK